MNLTIFVIWLIFFLIALYYSFAKRNHFGDIALIALGLGLFAILNGTGSGAGIDILSQVDSNGTLIYTAHTAANDVSIKAMAWAGFGVGMIGVIKFFSVLMRREE